MGVVYLAEHLALERKVAIKLLPRSKVDSEHVQRFLQEARTCGRIEHPNVVRIHNVGEEQGHYFIEMQYVDGQNLSEIVRVQGGPIPWRTALKIIRHAGKGLGAVHATGLVHRDIKPSNIMVAGANVYVMDFGLVREEGRSELTQTGVIVGTPAFMSPEQCLGQEVDRRTDVYSLGATLYYLLTAKLPYSEPNLRALLARVAARQLPAGVCDLNPFVPRAVGAFVGQAMAYDRRQRFARTDELLQELKHLLQPTGSPDASTIDTSRISLHDTKDDALVPALAPLHSIPTSTVDESIRPWKAGLAVGGALVGLLTISLGLNAVFGKRSEGEPNASPATTSTTPATAAAAWYAGRDVSGMVRIPAGYAQLGNDLTRLRGYLEQSSGTMLLNEDYLEPVARVHVPEYFIDQYEVTNADYSRFVAATGESPPRHWKGASPPPGTEMHPVTHVSHADALAYAEWAGKQLPTVAQWIRAFRGDSEQYFPWGSTASTDLANVGENFAFRHGPCDVTATPGDVSALGVFNLVGNAAEITRELETVDGVSVVIFKGSDWGASIFSGIGSGRRFAAPELKFETLEARAQDRQIGFRCVLEAPATE